MVISVIVPLYKGERYISRIIDMVEKNFGEDRSKAEIVFVNDDPNDFFREKDYESEVKLRFLNHDRNKGIHQAKIDGFQEAAGEYLLFLDQDDTIEANYFESQFARLQGHDAVFCNGFHRQGERIYASHEMREDAFYLDEYLISGYPLISLGQMLIRRQAVPKGWIENLIANNGWDDHFFWVCMMQEGASVVYNADCLFVHEEDGKNASFHWEEMRKSGIDFRDNVLKLKAFDRNQEAAFIAAMDKRLMKYDKYIGLDRLLEKGCGKGISDYLCANSIHEVAIYGMGVYGKKLCDLLDPQKTRIRYGIDRNACKKDRPFPVYEKIRNDIAVDCVICATGFDDENIKERLSCRTMTLQEILAAKEQ